jgi:hypothetical protein
MSASDPQRNRSVQSGTSMKFQTRSFLFAGACALTFATTASQAVVVFDNISALQAGTPGATITSTGSTPNTFIGDAYTLTAGTTQITGFDVFTGNLTGTTYTALKLNLYVWGGVNLGAASVATPAFSNLLGSYTFNAVGSYASGFYYSFQNVVAGSAPALSLLTPVAVPGTAVGVTINVQGSTDGVNFAAVNSLTSMITTGVPATVGSNVFNGYYRNAASESNGNFTSTLRSLGLTNQSMALRIYGDVTPVPEASTWLMMGLGLGLLALRHRKAR